MYSYRKLLFILAFSASLLVFVRGTVFAEEWVIDQTVQAPLELVEVNVSEECVGVSFLSLPTMPEGNVLVLRSTVEPAKSECGYWWILDSSVAYEADNTLFVGSTVAGNSVLFSSTNNPTEAFFCQSMPDNIEDDCTRVSVAATAEATAELVDPENRPNAAENTSESEPFVRPPASCESENTGIFNRVLCGATATIDRILIGDDGSGGIAGVVDNLLSIDSSQYANDKLRNSWSYFRNIASLALVLIGLIMVIGQAMSKD